MWGDEPGKDTAADHLKLWSELILKGEHMQCLFSCSELASTDRPKASISGFWVCIEMLN